MQDKLMLYLIVFTKNIKQQMMYRSEFLLSSVGALLFIYVQIAIWQALLGQSPHLSPLGINAMITYIIVAYILRQASRTHFAVAFADKMNKGDIAVDLIRPVNIKNMMISEQLSENICIIVFSCLPVAVIAGFIWGFEFIAGLTMMLLFLISAILAIALHFYLDYTFGLLVFWVRNANHPRQLLGGLITIFSGSAVPLWFYPEWLRNIGMFLPFSLLAFDPIQIFLATVSTHGAMMIITRQIGWLFAIWLTERLVWSRIKNNVFVQGG